MTPVEEIMEQPTQPTGEPGRVSAGSQGPLPGARTALILLLLINMFNYIDRQVLAAVEPQIRATFFTKDDPTAKFWMGWLSSAFMISYMIFSPVFGFLADRMSRWVLVAIGVTVWSLASGASGLAGTFFLLLLTRCFVGIGEAAYGPTAPSVISDLYPVKDRGRVLAWFYAAIPVGSALGYTLGGQMVASLGEPDPALGLVTGAVAAKTAAEMSAWRWAFYVVVPPGLLLAVLCLFRPEPPRGRVDAPTEPGPPRGPVDAVIEAGPPPGQVDAATLAEPPRLSWKDYRVLLQTPSYVLCTLGMAAMTFALGGIAYWMSAYLKYREVGPVFGLEPVTAFGAVTALTGLLATLLGGIAGDKLKPRFPGSYFLV